MNRPVIASLKAKMGVLERRKAYLEIQIQRPGEQSYNLAEISAIEAALSVCRWYAEDRDGSAGPMSVLAELVELESFDSDDGSQSQRDEVLALQTKAAKLLEEIE